jgi:hypothetical protein
MDEEPYIIAGHYLILAALIQNWKRRKILPPKIWSISRCISPKLPDSWVFTWTTDEGSRQERQIVNEILQMSDSEFLAFQKHFDRLFDEGLFGFPNVFMDLNIAKRMYSQYFQRIHNIKLITIGLPGSLREEFLESFKMPGYSENGVYIKINAGEPLRAYEKILGYDVAGYDGADFRSFLCNGFEQELYENLRISINQYGLISSVHEAEAAASYIRKTRAADEFWCPWLVVEHSLISEAGLATYP